MAFSPSVVACLVKKRLAKGGSWAPQDPPYLSPCSSILLDFQQIKAILRAKSDVRDSTFYWLLHERESTAVQC